MNIIYRISSRFRLGGWRRRAFTTFIESDVLGAFFRINMIVFWRRVADTPPEKSLAELHERIVESAEDVLAKSSVLSLESASIRLKGSLAELEMKLNRDRPCVIFQPSLDADIDSRKMALKCAQDVRLRKASLDDEVARLRFLRNEVFADKALSRVWWLQQNPELIVAIGNDLLLETVEAAALAQFPQTAGDDYEFFKLLQEFASWLRGGDSRAAMTISLFDALLGTVQATDMRDQLRRATAPSSAGEIQDQ